MVVMARSKRGVKIGLEYDIEVRDRNGRVIGRLKRKSHSFTKAFLTTLRTMWNCVLGTGDVTVSLTGTDGGSKTVYVRHGLYHSVTVMGLRAPSGDDSYGIRVGTSDQAFSKDDYELIGKIDNGSGAGQMLYGATTVESVTDENETSSYVRIIRSFTNNSGATITVKEIGIAFKNGYSTTTFANILMARDVLVSPQSVPDGAACFSVSSECS